MDPVCHCWGRSVKKRQSLKNDYWNLLKSKWFVLFFCLIYLKYIYQFIRFLGNSRLLSRRGSSCSCCCCSWCCWSSGCRCCCCCGPSCSRSSRGSPRGWRVYRGSDRRPPYNTQLRNRIKSDLDFDPVYQIDIFSKDLGSRAVQESLPQLINCSLYAIRWLRPYALIIFTSD